MKWWHLALYPAMFFVGWQIAEAFKPRPQNHIANPGKKVLTAKDVLLALEAHEAKCKPCPCGEGNDELAKQFAKTLKAEGIPPLPGARR